MWRTGAGAPATEGVTWPPFGNPSRGIADRHRKPLPSTGRTRDRPARLERLPGRSRPGTGSARRRARSGPHVRRRAPDAGSRFRPSQPEPAAQGHGTGRAVTRRREEVVEQCRQLTDEDFPARKHVLASALTGLCAHYSKTWQDERALAAVQEAADAYQRHVAVSPAAIDPDHAGSLNNLGAAMASLRRPSEAVPLLRPPRTSTNGSPRPHREHMTGIT